MQNSDEITMQKTIKAQLSEIAKGGATTDKQRELIRKQSVLAGVDFNENSRCRDCWRDQAVRLWRLICEQEPQEGRLYLLRAGVDVIWCGRRVNATCSDDDLAAMLENGLPRDFFRRIAGEDGVWL